MAYLVLALGILLNVSGQFLFKAWADGGPRWLFALGLGCFNLDAIAWAYSLRNGISFVETGLWWDSGAVVLLLLGNWWLFGWRPSALAFLCILLAWGFVLLAKH